jgi:peptidoglycan hydrolase FlgJ
LSLLTGLSSPTTSDAATTSAAAVGPRHADSDRQILQRKAVEFEAIYLTQMLQPMFETLGVPEPFGGGPGEDVWRSMQVQEYGKAIASAGGVGIADRVARELIAIQEGREGDRR